jgi:pimeloyl-ACP methyl ester carboxylesterase
MKTRVFEVGAQNGEEAIVFLHGHPGSAADWLGLLPHVASFARGIAFDLPGFGKADKPKEFDYSAGAHAAFVTRAFWELGVKRAHLVMHDLGGIGVLWGATHPDSFASAVLMGTGILLDFRWHPVARLYRARPIGEIATALTNGIGFRVAMRLYNPQSRNLPKEIVARWWREYPLRTRRAALGFYRATPPEAMVLLRESLRKMDVPALVFFGAHDPAVPVEQAERQRESFPSAEVVIAKESGHWPYLDDPENARAVIIPFLERQFASAAIAAGA